MEHNWRIINLFLSSVNPSSYMARADPYGFSSPARGSPRDLAIGIDAAEIDGPVSVFDRETASSARPGVAAELT